jgi:hypothetical protein
MMMMMHANTSLESESEKSSLDEQKGSMTQTFPYRSVSAQPSAPKLAKLWSGPKQDGSS